LRADERHPRDQLDGTVEARLEQRVQDHHEACAAVDALLDDFDSLPLNDEAANRAGRVRAELEAVGKMIGPNDLLIAGIALANNLTLVTNNRGEFARVPGLKLDDWESPG